MAFVFNVDSYFVFNVDSYAGFLGILSWWGTTLLICNRMISKFKCHKEYLSNECHKTKTKVMTLASHKGHKQPRQWTNQNIRSWCKASRYWFWCYLWLKNRVVSLLSQSWYINANYFSHSRENFCKIQCPLLFCGSHDPGLSPVSLCCFVGHNTGL